MAWHRLHADAAHSCTEKLRRPISLAKREASGSLTLISASLKRAPVAAYPASAGECFAGPVLAAALPAAIVTAAPSTASRVATVCA
jgi:hypothetical protein